MALHRLCGLWTDPKDKTTMAGRLCGDIRVIVTKNADQAEKTPDYDLSLEGFGQATTRVAGLYINQPRTPNGKTTLGGRLIGELRLIVFKNDKRSENAPDYSLCLATPADDHPAGGQHQQTQSYAGEDVAF